MGFALKKFFESILTLGVVPTDSKVAEFEVRSVNFFTMVMTIVGCVYTPLFYFLNLPRLSLMAPIATALYVPAFWLQLRGHRDLARVWSLWSFNTAMGIFSIVSGSALNIQLGFIISISVCFMFYTDWRQATKQAILNAVCYVFVASIQILFPPAALDVQKYSQISGLLITATIMAIVISVFSFFVRQVSILEGRLQDLVRKRETIISLISHDVRNPLASAISHLGIIRSGRFKDNPDKQLEMIKKSEDFLNFINLLLNNAQALLAAQTGKGSLQLSPVNLGDTVQKLKTIFAHQIATKEVSVVIDDKTTKPVSILADENLLTFSVLGNLLSNAIKFSPRGGVITITTKSDQNGILIEVQDQGIGVPASLLPILFESNKATTRRGTDNEKGTGFGLPLAKEIMRLHGGTITAISPASSSANNPGTIFRAVFPKEKVTQIQ